MKIRTHNLYTEKPGINLRLACISDLHSRSYTKVIASLKKVSPDIILRPGDIVEVATEYNKERNQNGIDFLRKCANIAPTYYTYGNHEIYNSYAKDGQSKTPDKRLAKQYIDLIKSFGVKIINDEYVNIETLGYCLSIGGVVGGWV